MRSSITKLILEILYYERGYIFFWLNACVFFCPFFFIYRIYKQSSGRDMILSEANNNQEQVGIIEEERKHSFYSCIFGLFTFGTIINFPFFILGIIKSYYDNENSDKNFF